MQVCCCYWRYLIAQEVPAAEAEAGAEQIVAALEAVETAKKVGAVKVAEEVAMSTGAAGALAGSVR